MKQKIKIMKIIGFAGLVMGIMLNLEYAIGDYGIQGNLVQKLLAQTSSTNTTSGSTITSTDPKALENQCRKSGGYWNLYLGVMSGGVKSVKCTRNGELTLTVGITVKGSYSKGVEYPVFWTLYGCIEGKENCCYKNEQGISAGVK